jgi:DNA polymerase III epsilon subunit-like protein
MFRIAVSRADNVIAHNLDFDERVMLRSQSIAGENDIVTFKNRICTMKAATPICKIPSAYKAGDYKWPTLTEAHQHFVGRPFEDAHDALNDCLACWRVLRALREGGHV